MFHISDTIGGLIKKKKRVGRGEGSNRGKNSGKGHKGQTKRAGKSPVTFEGGKKSLVRRTPKVRGFNQVPQSKRKVTQITTGLIDFHYSDGEAVSFATLVEKGMVNKNVKKVRIIKKGDLTKKLTFAEEDTLHLTKGVKKVITA